MTNDDAKDDARGVGMRTITYCGYRHSAPTEFFAWLGMARQEGELRPFDMEQASYIADVPYCNLKTHPEFISFAIWRRYLKNASSRFSLSNENTTE